MAVTVCLPDVSEAEAVLWSARRAGFHALRERDRVFLVVGVSAGEFERAMRRVMADPGVTGVVGISGEFD